MSKLQEKIDGWVWERGKLFIHGDTEPEAIINTEVKSTVDIEALMKREFECQKIKQILTDIRNYLVAILDEWHRRSDEPNFYEQNIGVYNHIRKELDDLTEYAEKLGVEL